jgi:glycosyltransferase involved in cell wall biosynthesis
MRSTAAMRGCREREGARSRHRQVSHTPRSSPPSGRLLASTPAVDVSIIIPTREAAVDLSRCLASIQVTDLSVEAIVVDQGSTDDTTVIAARYGATVLEVTRSAFYTPPTPSRNAGSAVAKGDFLLHLDADMELAPHVLDEAVRTCREGGHVALTFEEVDVPSGFWATCKALERRTYRNSLLLEGARFVRADVFRAVGGYDEELGSGEDWDVHARYAAEGTIGRLPNATFHHLGTISPVTQLRKKYDYGRTSAAFLGKQGGGGYSAEMVRSYARSWRLFARDPAHAVGFAALRVGEAGALAAGLTVESVRRRRS